MLLHGLPQFLVAVRVVQPDILDILDEQCWFHDYPSSPKRLPFKVVATGEPFRSLRQISPFLPYGLSSETGIEKLV
jgi:hypothetical protein